MGFETFKALIAAYHIDRRHALYRRTNNPVHAWSAYRTARQLQQPVPSWVLDFLDTWATVLTTEKRPSAKAIADSLKIDAKGIDRATRDVRDLEIAARVVGDRSEPTPKVTVIEAPPAVRAAIDALLRDSINVQDSDLDVMMPIADEYGLTVERVRDIYYKVIGSPTRS